MRPFVSSAPLLTLVAALATTLIGCNQSKPVTIEGRVLVVMTVVADDSVGLGVKTRQGIENVIVVGKSHVGATVVKLRKARSLEQLRFKRVRITGLRLPSGKGIVATALTELSLAELSLAELSLAGKTETP